MNRNNVHFKKKKNFWKQLIKFGCLIVNLSFRDFIKKEIAYNILYKNVLYKNVFFNIQFYVLLFIKSQRAKSVIKQLNFNYFQKFQSLIMTYIKNLDN